jgi:hypothetical protein
MNASEQQVKIAKSISRLQEALGFLEGNKKHGKTDARCEIQWAIDDLTRVHKANTPAPFLY